MLTAPSALGAPQGDSTPGCSQDVSTPSPVALDAASRPVGLSYVTYLTAGEQPDHVLMVAAEGRGVKSHPILSTKRPRTGGGARSTISQFSPQSRMRLLWRLAGLRAGSFAPALFITLTYPAGEVSPRESKRHLDNFIKRLHRRFPGCAGLWKLEYQKNGTAHYHLILLGVPFWNLLDMKKVWADIVKSDHPHHQSQGAHVDLVVSQRQAAHYMGKYIGKDARVPEDHYGRVWGTFGEVDRFESQRVAIGLDRNQMIILRRVFDAIRKSKSKRPFKRAWDLRISQRWFLEGAGALAVVDRLFGPDPPGS